MKNVMGNLKNIFSTFLLIFVSCHGYDNLLQGLRSYDFFPAIYAGTLEDVTDGNSATCLISQTTSNTAYFRLNMSQVYSIKELGYSFRPLHVHRMTPISIFLSNTSTGTGQQCFQYADFSGLPPESGSFSCNGTGQYLFITINRGSGLPAQWRPDEAFASVSFCELSIPGCRMYGRFGTSCSQICNCRTFTCDYETGECPNGECAAGWTGPACNISTFQTTESSSSSPVPSSTRQASVSTSPSSLTVSSSSTKKPSSSSPSNTQSTSIGGVTAPLIDAFTVTSDGIGPGLIAAVAMVAVSFIIVIGLIFIVGRSLRGRELRK